MITRDYLVIGAGVGGISVCEGIRTYDKRGRIMLVGNENHLPYHRVSLSKAFLSAKRPHPEELLVEPAEWYEHHKIDLRLNTVVTQLNLERRLAVLNNGQTVEFNKACLATGSRPTRPLVAGANLGNVIYLRTLADALALREMAELESGVLIVGGGFIAVEAAAALRQAKRKVGLLAREQHLWQAMLDRETAAWLTEYFRQHEVNLYLQESLNGFEGKTVLKNVQTKSGDRISTALALVAVGTDLNLELVRNTPLSGPKGTPVTEYLETDEKGIYAVGDIALYPDRLFGGVRRVDHWDNARQQGLLVGANMTGKKRQRYDYLPSYTSQLFDLKWQFLGDFTLPPTRFEIDGSREKKKFALRFFHNEKLRGAVLCNRSEDEAEEIKKTIRAAYASSK
ncbi:MAG: FAD-dependent oxidoreductase [Verrucomicrobia bacterium]|nr:FAD-dependent oxidoreductase [Verrucomicrobiota bacterium]MBV9656844.1 FAD-dependent oxidoreductase [Verrucomicrobiota bacterium]